MFAGNFAPAGWMFCEGQLLPISENETLFQLSARPMGGDGESTFALPDLRGRLPAPRQRLHPGRDRRRRGCHADGSRFRHTGIRFSLDRPGSTSSRQGKVTGRVGGGAKPYIQDDTERKHEPRGSDARSAASQPHTNFQPYLCINFIISLFGIFPSPT